MATYVLRRIIQSIPILFGISILIFLIVQLAPGSPIDRFRNPRVSARAARSTHPPVRPGPPLIEQYFHWITAFFQVWRIDAWGYSFIDGQPVLRDRLRSRSRDDPAHGLGAHRDPRLRRSRSGSWPRSASTARPTRSSRSSPRSATRCRLVPARHLLLLYSVASSSSTLDRVRLPVVRPPVLGKATGTRSTSRTTSSCP